MPFPTTRKEMIEQGYTFERLTNCRGCNAPIEFYKTPKGKYMPFDKGTAMPHWKTCPNADDFRKKKK